MARPDRLVNRRRLADETKGIDGPAVHTDLVMKMHPGRAPRRAHVADQLPLAHSLGWRNTDSGKVAIARPNAVRMLDLDQIAVASRMPGNAYDTAGGGKDASSERPREIDTRMNPAETLDGIGPPPERR